MAPTRRLFVSIVAASALLLAACGGDTTDTELATTDDGATPSAETRSSDGAETEGNAPVGLSIIGDEGEDGPVPEAVVPSAPDATTSPAERQRMQELGLVDQARTAPEMPVIPTGDGDSDAPSAPAAAAADSTRSDLDQFPEDIPAIVPGAPNGPTSSAPGVPSTSSANGSAQDAQDVGNAGIVGGLDVDTELGLPAGDAAVTRVESAQLAPDADVDDDVATSAEVLAEEANAECLSGGACDDIALQSGAGVGDASGTSVQAADPDADPDAGPSDSYCAVRPYDRGCPLPGSGASGVVFDDVDGDDDLDSDRQGEGQGVNVPQSVIDALLAPVDNDDEPSDDGEVADGEDSPQVPADDSEAVDAADIPD